MSTEDSFSLRSRTHSIVRPFVEGKYIRRFIKCAAYRILGGDTFFTLGALRQIYGHYEPHFLQFLAQIAQHGTLLDVGANVGITCGITSRKRPDLQIIAFEPVPQNLRVLRRIKSILSIANATICPVAIGDQDGSISFTIPIIDGRPGVSLCHVVSNKFQNAEHACHKTVTADVEMRTLDSYHFDRVDAIKIDVEDHEFHVLNGARSLIERFHPVICCELWDSPNRTHTFALMRELGYECHSLSSADFLFTPKIAVETYTRQENVRRSR